MSRSLNGSMLAMPYHERYHRSHPTPFKPTAEHIPTALQLVRGHFRKHHQLRVLGSVSILCLIGLLILLEKIIICCNSNKTSGQSRASGGGDELYEFAIHLLRKQCPGKWNTRSPAKLWANEVIPMVSVWLNKEMLFGPLFNSLVT